ncbi:MAG: N-acetyltransferase family protein [Beijerinckiaceae bacterium]
MTISLRPFLPADAPDLIAIFREAVMELTVDEYDEDQREAWASAADDEEAFAAELGNKLTILAIADGQTVGFASLEGTSHLAFLYVHPDAAGQGAATALIDAMEKLSQARGAKELSGDISDTARGFFERRGWSAQSRNTVHMDGEWLANTTMKIVFSGGGSAPPPVSTARH